MTNHQFDIVIDKLTRSLENTISGDSFKTEVILLSSKDLRGLKSREWLFNWKAELKVTNRSVYKLVTVGNPSIIQGLISVEDKGDHIFMHLIETSFFNRGKSKLYLGVPANLVAFACLLSFIKGYEGFVSFESKTKLIEHYQNALGANVLFGNIMALDMQAATRLVKQYFLDSNYL